MIPPFANPRQSWNTDNRRGRARPRRAGAYLVEFAVVVPIVFALIFGMIEIGRSYMVTHQLSNAARRGCRVATLAGTNSTQVDQEVQAALAGQRIAGGQTTVYVNDAVADASTASAGDEVTVVVSVSTANVTWLPGLTYVKGNLTGKYSLRRE